MRSKVVGLLHPRVGGRDEEVRRRRDLLSVYTKDWSDLLAR